MRRALGLGASSPARTDIDRPTPLSSAQIHRRHFVRDGEVPVTVVRHDDPGATNKLEAARQALREQIAAREQIERQLEEARATIQALETQLAHGRIAKDEALRRSEDQRRRTQCQLEQERQARHLAEQERNEAEERLREATATQEAQKQSGAAVEGKRGGKVGRSQIEASAASVTAEEPRRRGRPPKARETRSEIVEWWKPGWRERF